jgi:CRISPR-associated protein Csd1
LIFQSLISLYTRLARTNEVPPYGFSKEDIGFVLHIDKDGNLMGEPEELRKQIKQNVFDFYESIVPYSNEVNVRSSSASETPNFMLDKADYIFGMSGNEKKEKHHESFINLITEVCGDSDDEGVVAVKLFLKNWTPEDSSKLKDWKDISGAHGKWIAFKLKGDSKFVHERDEVRRLWEDHISIIKYPRGVCFVDGEVHDLQPQYAQFKFGSGASLVSFNEVAYESYGKKKGENAPISVDAEFKSAAALKYLLRSKTQRLRIGDTTTVFWAEKQSSLEMFMGMILNPSIEDKGAAIPVQKFLEAVRDGKFPDDIERDKEIKFYILGLSQNKARLALRFWYVSTVKELIERLSDHFKCLEMEKSKNDYAQPFVWNLLKETAREPKNISPILNGALMRSILTGVNYPQNLYQGVLGRIRADQAKKDEKTGKTVSHINYLRAAILKAVLQRNHKIEVPMSLDPNRREVEYLLGRLFAVLEKAQLDALGKVNATIKDRFFSAASAAPASVFPRLIRLSQHHLKKSVNGDIADERISEIMEHINEFPPQMNLQQQGLFAIAYYQQRNAL